MGSFFTFDRKQVLCATETEALYVDVLPGKRGRERVNVLTHLEKKPDTELDAATLIAGTGRKKAKVALVLPLKDFQLVAVTVPPLAREAVAKVLPYSLAKVLNTSVTEHIYDWQVAQKFKDRHELTVYLYSAVRFLQYRNELEARKKEIVWFEPDVFAACSYLYSIGRGRRLLLFSVFLSGVDLYPLQFMKITVLRWCAVWRWPCRTGNRGFNRRQVRREKPSKALIMMLSPQKTSPKGWKPGRVTELMNFGWRTTTCREKLLIGRKRLQQIYFMSMT